MIQKSVDKEKINIIMICVSISLMVGANIIIFRTFNLRFRFRVTNYYVRFAKTILNCFFSPAGIVFVSRLLALLKAYTII